MPSFLPRETSENSPSPIGWEGRGEGAFRFRCPKHGISFGRSLSCFYNAPHTSIAARATLSTVMFFMQRKSTGQVRR